MAHEGLVRALKKLNRVPANADNYRSFFKGLELESDRGFIILLVTAIEDALISAIRTKFIPLTQDEDDEIFTFNGPLGSFSSAIQIGYALGILGREVRDQMNLMRVLRNTCAHARHNVSIETPQLRDAVIGCLKPHKMVASELAVAPASHLRFLFGLACWFLARTLQHGPPPDDPAEIWNLPGGEAFSSYIAAIVKSGIFENEFKAEGDDGESADAVISRSDTAEDSGGH